MGWVARYTSPDTTANVQLVTRDATAPEDSVISVLTDDVEGAYAEAQRLGYEIVHPLTAEPWGHRRFFVRAPDGNVINVGTTRTDRSTVPATCDLERSATLIHATVSGRSRSLFRTGNDALTGRDGRVPMQESARGSIDGTALKSGSTQALRGRSVQERLAGVSTNDRTPRSAIGSAPSATSKLPARLPVWSM